MKHGRWSAVPGYCGLAIALAAFGASMALAVPQQDLLTQVAVEEVLGVAVKVEPRGNNGNSFTSSAPLGAVTIDLSEASVSRMLKGSNETIPDLGDDAFFLLAMSNSVVLHVVSGDTAFILSVSYPVQKPEGVTDLQAVAKTLAEKALENL